MFYIRLGCIQGTPRIQGTPPFLINRHFIFTIDKNRYTSSYIYLTDFEIKFIRFTVDSSHIADYPFECQLGPFIVLCTLHVYILDPVSEFTLNPAKMDI